VCWIPRLGLRLDYEDDDEAEDEVRCMAGLTDAGMQCVEVPLWRRSKDRR
jgi:hypothetical protein